MTHRALWLSAVALLHAAPAFADDVSATIAALKGEKAECRYLLQLCAEYSASRLVFREKVDAAQAAMAAAHKSIEGARRISPEAAAARRDAQSAVTLMDAAQAISQRKLLDVTSAAKVLKAKREKMPSCVSQCVDESDKAIITPW